MKIHTLITRVTVTAIFVFLTVNLVNAYDSRGKNALSCSRCDGTKKCQVC
jgi:hypothetical protein